MQRGVNKVIVIGHLDRDAELRYTQNQTPLLSMRLAIPDSFIGQSGEPVQRTEWINAVLWGKQAPDLQPMLLKDVAVYVEGSLTSRQYEDRDGNTRYVTEIKVRDIVLLGEGGLSDVGYTSEYSQAAPSYQRQSAGPRSAPPNLRGGGQQQQSSRDTFKEGFEPDPGYQKNDAFKNEDDLPF